MIWELLFCWTWFCAASVLHCHKSLDLPLSGWQPFPHQGQIKIIAFNVSSFLPIFIFTIICCLFETKTVTARRASCAKKMSSFLYSTTSLPRSPSFHHKNGRKSLCPSDNVNWWNMLLMSLMKATLSSLNLHRIPRRVFVWSGPCNKWLFKDTPSYWAKQ